MRRHEGERETRVSILRRGEKYLTDVNVSVCSQSVLVSKNRIKATRLRKSAIFSVQNSKDLKTGGEKKEVERRGRWKVGMVWQKMTETEVRCNTLKEAELIPDSAVPYTLPESRCNSSNHQRSKFERRARGEGGARTRRMTRVRRRTLKECRRSGGVKEDETQPVNQREDLAAFASLHTCGCVRSVALQVAEGKRTSGSEPAAQPRRTAERRTVTSLPHTHTLRRGMPLENHVCMPYISVDICVCTHVRVCSSPL